MTQTALVTGATSGIGESLCLLFASDGYNLVTVARDEKALNDQAEKLRLLDVDVLPVSCDLSKPDAAHTLFNRVRDAGKDIEILVNDAGYSPAGQFSDLSIADIRAMLQVSVTSLSELTSVFLHPMLERGHGRILNMSSMMALTPCPYNALYGAAKVFVLSFTTALHAELKGTGVTATTVCPGATRTNFPKNAGIEGAPAWKYFSMSADDTAAQVYGALMRGERCAVTGWYNKAGAVATRVMPLGFQLMAGKWLMGVRTHPLGHEGTEDEGGKARRDRRDRDRRDHRGRRGDNAKRNEEARDTPRSQHGKEASDDQHSKGGEGGQPGEKSQRKDDEGQQHGEDQREEGSQPKGWRSGTIGAQLVREAREQQRREDQRESADSDDRREGNDQRNRQSESDRKHHHKGPRDGVPANLGYLAWHGRWSKQ